MRNPAGKLSEGVELSGVNQPLFELPSLGHVEDCSGPLREVVLPDQLDPLIEQMPFLPVRPHEAVLDGHPVEELRGAHAPIAMLTSTHAGAWAGSAVARFAAISAFGCLNAVVLLLGEMPFGTVRDGQLPEWIAPGVRTGSVSVHCLPERGLPPSWSWSAQIRSENRF